jgi:Chaperone of endosialidase
MRVSDFIRERTLKMESTEIQRQQKRKIENMTTLHSRKSINRSPLRLAFLLIPLVFVCFGLSPVARAVVPAPDGGYPGFNTAEGTNALFSLTSGTANTAIGFNALFNNTTGGSNTGTGFQVLFRNTTGFQNAATGWRALFENTTGFHNTASGFEALFFNTTGNHNTADGDVALAANETGNFNTAEGAHALRVNTTGSSNTALGFEAGFHITGNGNVCIGEGIFGLVGENNVTRIRNIGSTAQANGIFVTVGAGGKLGRQVSSRRYKDDIKPMDKASEALFALKPVSFRYKQEIDPARSPDFGLIAEDVATVNPDLVARDEEGKIVTVRYQAVNTMLLNEFLKEHRKVEEQEAAITQLKSTVVQQQKGFQAAIAQQQREMEAITARVKEQASQIQKVSAQLELSKSALQTVVNDQ